MSSAFAGLACFLGVRSSDQWVGAYPETGQNITEVRVLIGFSGEGASVQSQKLVVVLKGCLRVVTKTVSPILFYQLPRVGQEGMDSRANVNPEITGRGLLVIK